MSQSYHHILIASDLTHETELLYQRAADLALEHHAELSICHVVEDAPLTDFAYEPLIAVDISLRDALVEQGEVQLADMAAKWHIPADHRWVACGRPAEDIVLMADQHQVDLIIMGAHHRSGLKGWLHSITDDVTHHAHCDVLTVHLPTH